VWCYIKLLRKNVSCFVVRPKSAPHTCVHVLQDGSDCSTMQVKATRQAAARGRVPVLTADGRLAPAAACVHIGSAPRTLLRRCCDGRPPDTDSCMTSGRLRVLCWCAMRRGKVMFDASAALRSAALALRVCWQRDT
jgi:hypothetical protein